MLAATTTISTGVDHCAIDSTRLLKTLCYALRHAPRKFGLVLTGDGFTPLEALVSSLLTVRKEYRNVLGETLRVAIAHLDTERFEIYGSSIRARYGHSVSVVQIGTIERPPEILFHGTSTETVDLIKIEGLQPIDRFYVHLTSNIEYAINVGNAKGEMYILKVRAKAAHDAGIVFRRANSHVWIASEISAKFIESCATELCANTIGINIDCEMT
jgi:putative RNA 2'-phosphotransferase